MKTNSKKKILIIGSSKLPIPSVKGGAVPNLIENIIKTNEIQKKLNITCLSCFDSNAKLESEKYKNTNFIWVKTPRIIEKIDKLNYFIFKKIFHFSRLLSLSYFFHIMWFTVAVSKHLKNNNYNSVVFENSIPVLHSLRLYGNKKKYDNKYYLHIHTVPRNYYLNKKIIAQSNSIICISNYVKNKIKNTTGIKEEKFSVLYNSIDLNLFKPESNRSIEETKLKYSLPKNKKIILFAGRLCKDKGIDKILEAQKKLSDEFVLLVVGSNFYKTSIKSDFEKKLIEYSEGIKDRVIFTGYIDYNEMPKVYNCADIVVLPSMWEEPAGMTIIEAMSCKKPVITTISGGIPEYTSEGNCVLLNRDDNISNNIANSIVKIDSNEKMKNQLSKNAIERSKIFNLNYYYSSFNKIINGEKI